MPPLNHFWCRMRCSFVSQSRIVLHSLVYSDLNMSNSKVHAIFIIKDILITLFITYMPLLWYRNDYLEVMQVLTETNRY